ncbi:TolC family protein [Dokdonia sinensis]|uniref:TolC family protein n=1 Tax=Dokdonia sinensis TaxID=2479847 RepID=A0A3M0G2R8_9FLAO|nr:TolC family protein [Dokdonia sinensis]RMB56492.1 TolC family protein [Dokdonia sinensis]
MKKALLFCITAMLATVTFGQDKKWTLQECVQYALDNNITIQQSELALLNATIDKSDAIGNFVPNVNARANVSENTGLSFNPVTNQPQTVTTLNATGGINLGYTLFDGLRNLRQLQRADLNRVASEFNLARAKDDIALLVSNAFLDIILNKENLKTIKAQNEITLEQIERTQQLVDGGVLPKGDLLEIRATAATERQRIVAAENAVELSRISLAQLLAVDNYQAFDVVDGVYDVFGDEILDLPVGTIIDSARTNRFEVKIAEQNLELAKKDLQISKGARYPTLSAFFGYDTRFTTNDFIDIPFETQIYNNDGINYGLSLNIPILNGFSVRNGIRRNKINVQSNEVAVQQARLDLEANVYQAYTAVKAAKESYEAARIAVESQELAYQYATDRYDVGLTNAFDFSQSKLRYDNAQIELARSKYDYIFRIKVLELFYGVPATELKF